MSQKISCVIPVYNEAERVKGVLDVIVENEFIDEIIAVNDGSTDNSEEVLKKINGIKLISYSENKGKTNALKKGIEASKNEWIMTIDSDLIGLDKSNITALIKPVIGRKADVSISLRKNSLLIFKIFNLDFVSGERVFQKSLVGDIDKLDKLPSFGFEAYLNEKIISNKLRIKVVNWKNVITPRKSTKFGFWAGIKGDTKMVLQIFSILGIFGTLIQYYKMLKLKI